MDAVRLALRPPNVLKRSITECFGTDQAIIGSPSTLRRLQSYNVLICPGGELLLRPLTSSQCGSFFRCDDSLAAFSLRSISTFGTAITRFITALKYWNSGVDSNGDDSGFTPTSYYLLAKGLVPSQGPPSMVSASSICSPNIRDHFSGWFL